MYIAKYHEHTKNLHLPVLKMMKIDEDWVEDQLNSLLPPSTECFILKAESCAFAQIAEDAINKH